MIIRSIRAIHGPNVFHHRPVLIMVIDLGPLTDLASSECEGFNQRLLKMLPQLHNHNCSPGYSGGFVERLERGTYPAHIIEHIALELSELCGIGVDYGKTVYGGSHGVYQIAVRFRSEEGMKEILHVAVELAEAVYGGRDYDLEAAIKNIKSIVKRTDTGPSTRAILEAAKKRNIPVMKLEGLDIFQLGWGKYRRLIQATTTSRTTDLGVQMARDKEFTKKLLQSFSIPVPRGEVVQHPEDALEVMRELGNVAVKPFDGNHGRGVTLNVSDENEMVSAYSLAMSESTGGVLIEECFKGRDYRVVVVDGKVVAASERIAAHVTGDGKSSISDLINQENQNPMRGEGHEKPLTFLCVDERKNIDLSRIPEEGEIVFLCDTANISTGGEGVDVTDFIHPEIRKMCERIAIIAGLDVCGLDLIFEDITRPMKGQKGGVIEINAGPGIRMHHYPSRGTPRDVGAAIVDYLFREKTDGRIPVVSITGTNGKTTVTRLMDHVFRCMGLRTGTTTTNGIFIDGIQVADGDTTGPVSARTVLSDPTVEVAILETARGGIVKRGLGYDWSDVGIITNIHADHLGQDGIESIDDILRIKSLIAERVRPGGTIILNADVPELVQLARSSSYFSERKLIYISLNEFNPVVHQHVMDGGVAYTLLGDDIYRNGEKIISSMEIPLTLGGTASFHVANVLTVMAAAEAMEVSRDLLMAALKTFSHHEQNKGRTNLFKVGRGHVLIDYGHNPDALIGIGAMTRKWNVTKRTGVITTPGDRSDDLIRMSGIAAAHLFDKIIVREDFDLRERRPGEVAAILCDAVQYEKPSLDCHVILSPLESLRSAVSTMEAAELVVYFYESYEETLEVLRSIGAVEAQFKDVLFHREDEGEMMYV